MPTLSTNASSAGSTPVLHDRAIPIPQVAYRRINMAQTQNFQLSPVVRSIRMPTQRTADTLIWMTCLINRLVSKFEVTRLQSKTYIVVSLDLATWSRGSAPPSRMGRPGSYRHSTGRRVAAMFCCAGQTFRRAVILVTISQYAVELNKPMFGYPASENILSGLTASRKPRQQPKGEPSAQYCRISWDALFTSSLPASLRV